MFKDVLIDSIIFCRKDIENKRYDPIFSFKLKNTNSILLHLATKQQAIVSLSDR